jgi:tripartite-type tricarboxylate transporter receptor subunit TctC
MLSRRVFAALGMSVMCFPIACSSAVAQGSMPLPPGNITLVVAFPAGGPLDVTARLFADKFGAKYGRTVVVENKPGAAGMVGGATVARAEPNGLTWLMTLDSTWSVNPHLGAKPTYDIDNDLVPVGRVGQFALALTVNEKVPAKTWPELVAYSKTKSLNFGSAGVGSPGHLAFEYLKMLAPLDAVHVPFRGNAQAIQELLAGNVDGGFVAPGGMIDHFKTGKVRGLAVSDTKRLPQLPDVPTAKEAGIGDFVAIFSNVLALPAKTPDAIRQFLAAELKAFIFLPDVIARHEPTGTEAMATDTAEARVWFATERERWGKVIKARGIEVKP